MKTLSLILATCAVALFGCEGKTTVKMSGVANAPVNTGDPTVPQVPGGTPSNPGPAPRCALGQTYTGFGGMDLTADRIDADLGVDRGRVKPFAALQTEYARVLGNKPALLSTMGSTFGAPPARWFQEPQGSAITTYSAFRIGFQGCLTATASDGGTPWGVVPNANTAQSQCQTWATSFWSRDPSSDEVAACVDYAVNGTAAETSPNRRWAYTCASVISSAGFLTY